MKTLVAVPCGDMLHTDFARSLVGLKLDGQVQFTFAQGSLVYDARNKLAYIAIDNGFDRVLWLDSDMVFPSGLFQKLSMDLDEGREIVSALPFTRKRPIHPAVFKAVYKDSNGIPHAEYVEEWPNRVFEVAACGFATVMCSVDLLKRMRDKYGLLFSPLLGFGEDLSFCLRATDMGAKIYCDPTIEIGHVGLAIYSKESYMIERRHSDESE